MGRLSSNTEIGNDESRDIILFEINQSICDLIDEVKKYREFEEEAREKCLKIMHQNANAMH